MMALFYLCLALFVSPFKSKSRLEAENAATSLDNPAAERKDKTPDYRSRRLQLQRHAA
jgi:hypothetical protein